MRRIAVFLLLAGWLAAVEEPLVDAQWNGPWADQAGMQWDLMQDGQISDGSNDCFDSAMQLTATVAGARWTIQKQQQTADGQEYVLSGKAGPCTVERRIRLDGQRGWLRYCETVVNPTDKTVSAQLAVRGNCGGNAQIGVGTDGKPLAGGPLQKGNLGAVLVQQANNSRPSVVWLVGDGRGTVVPTLVVTGNRSFQAQWSLTVPAKGSASVYHLIAQRAIFAPGGFADTVKAVWNRRLVKPLLPPGAVLANWRTVEEAPVALPLVEALAEEFAIEDRAADLVVVDAGEGARLRGTLAGGPLVVATRFGQASVPVEQLAAARAIEGAAVLHLRNGEILAVAPGAAVSGRLELASGEGVRLPIDVSRTPAVLLRRRADDGAAGGQAGLLDLADGTRIALGGTLPELALATAWGPQAVPLAAIERIERVREPRPAWRVRLSDGSRFTAVPAALAVTLPTTRFGAQSVPLTQVVGYQRAGGPAAMEDEEPAPPVSWRGFLLVGGDRLAGSLGQAELELVASGTASRVPAASLRTLRRDGTSVAAVLVDGTTVAGTVRGTLAIGGGALAYRVPPALLVGWQDGTEPQDVPAIEPAPAPAKDDVEQEAMP